MNIVTLLLWAVLGWLVGILAYFTVGFIAQPIVSKSRVNSIANHYSEIAMKLLERAVLVERGTKYDIYRTSHDPEKNADTFNLDGETAHVTNDTGLLTTLHKKPLGMVPPPEEGISSYVSPEVAEFGEIEADRKEHGEIRDGGSYDPDVTLSPGRPLVQLRDYARHMIPGGRSLYDLDETIDLYQQSQKMFGSSKTTQFMILIMAYGAAMLVTWIILSQTGNAAAGVDVPVPPMGGGS